MQLRNQRQHQRKPVRIKGSLIADNIQHKITLVDLSEKGLGFLTDRLYAIGEIINLEIQISREHSIQLKVEIKNRMSDIFANRIGAQIIDCSQGFIDYVKSFFTKPSSPFARHLHQLTA